MRDWGWICLSLIGGGGVKEGERKVEGNEFVAGCVWGGCIMGRNLVGRGRGD